LVPIEKKSTSLRNCVRQMRHRRNLDHDAGGQIALAALLGELERLVDGGDHRRHDPGLLDAVVLGGVGDRVKLPLDQAGVRPAEADAADAEGRVLLVLVVRERNRLVRARVEGAHDDLLAGERREHLAVDARLLGDRGFGLGRQEAQLGAEQAHAFGL
jgi:hypothetical protein